MQVLRTDRLLLRWFCDGDAPRVLALLNDPAWIRFIGDRGVRTLDAARAYIASRLVAHYWYRGHGFWAVERRADGEFVGLCGLFQRDSLPQVDVGYALLPEHRGHGYAREAATACLHYGADVLGLRRILAITSLDNDVSAHVLRQIGMEDLGTQQLTGEPAPSRLFAWTAPSAARSNDDGADASPDDAQIAALIRRLFAALDSRDGVLAPVTALPHYFLPTAVITRCCGRGVETVDVRGFVEQCADRLLGGRWTDCQDGALSQRVQILGRMAQGWVRCRRTGTRDGVVQVAEGQACLQRVKVGHGETLAWKIAALSWDDARSDDGQDR